MKKIYTEVIPYFFDIKFLIFFVSGFLHEMRKHESVINAVTISHRISHACIFEGVAVTGFIG